MALHPGHQALLSRGVHAQLHSETALNLWGPVVPDQKAVDWIGAPHHTNNTGELSAFYHAVQRILFSQTPVTTARRNNNIPHLQRVLRPPLTGQPS